MKSSPQKLTAAQVQTINSYQYWNGASFQSTRITSGYSTAAVLKNVSPGSVHYNSYYNRYVALNLVNGNTLQAYTASVPQGPWSSATTLWSNSSYGGYVPLYDPQGLSFRDTSGKTLIAQMSQFGANTIKVTIKLVSKLWHSMFAKLTGIDYPSSSSEKIATRSSFGIALGRGYGEI